MKQTTQEEMFRCIERWEASKLSQKAFCVKHGVSYYTFKYWLRKYKITKGLIKTSKEQSHSETFIPVEIACPDVQEKMSKRIEIVFPGGIQLLCPMDIDFKKLKTLLGV